MRSKQKKDPLKITATEDFTNLKALFRQIAVMQGTNYQRDYRNHSAANTNLQQRQTAYNLEKERKEAYKVGQANFNYKTSQRKDFEGKPKHQLQFIDG